MSDLLDKLEDMGAEVDDTLDRLMGDEEMYLEYLQQFPENQNIHNFMDAVEKRDADTAMKEIHTLKGVALNLGLLPLVDVCMDVLLDFRGGKPEEAFLGADAVQECFEDWASVIKESF